MLHVSAISASALKKAKAAAYDKALAAMVAAGIEVQKARKALAAQKAAGLPYEAVAA